LKVITVSRQYGSGGSEFGKRLAERLGYHYADGSLLKAMEKNLRDCSPLLCSIEDEVGPGFLDKVAGLMSNHSFYKTALCICVLELALKSDVVMVGAGAHLILADCPSLISFQIVKRLSDRVRSVAHENGIKVDEALKFVEHKDKEKSQFIKYYFDKDLFDPLMFHLTINTSLLGLDDMVELLAAYCEGFYREIDGAASEQFLKNRLLEKKSQMVLFHLGMTHGTAVEFEADQGILTARGVIGGEHEKGRLLEALKKISEVTRVIDDVKVEVLSRNLY
jgi:CMP/dCMP kinase